MNNQILLNGITVEQLAEALKPLLINLFPTEQSGSENDLITRDEVCELLHFNKTSLWKHTTSGLLKSYSVGKRVLYKRSEVLQAVKPINH